MTCNILTKKGLFDRYIEILPECKNGREAYDRLCSEIEQKYGIEPRYTSYASFRSNMSVYHKKRVKKGVY